jgi:hypothetical protein
MLSFTLSMPSNNAWNGKWSGEGKLYAVVRSMGQSKKAKEAAKAVLEKGYFTHNFGDGWVAGVEVKEVSAAEARKIRKRSSGFMGYEWMVDSIIAHGEIRS